MGQVTRLSGKALQGIGCDLWAKLVVGKAAATARTYRTSLEAFATWWKRPDVPQALGAFVALPCVKAHGIVLEYLASLEVAGASASVRSARVAALRSVVAVARLTGHCQYKLEVPSPKAEKYRDTRGPQLDDVRRLFTSTASEKHASSTRDYAILRLLFDLGLRRGEVESLDVEHVDMHGQRVFVLGKGRGDRSPISVPPPTLEALCLWLTVRGTAPGPLFTNRDRAGKGERLTGTSIYRIVRDRASLLGFSCRPHGLRHAAITAALDRTGGDVRAVARFSRHRDLRTLTAYDDSRQDLGGAVASLVAARVP